MNNNVILTENFLKYSGPNNLFKYSILYGGIFTPYTCTINYVNMQKIVYKQDNYVYMQVTNPLKNQFLYE